MARSAWAKSDAATDGWLPLHRHMEDAAEAASLLWDEWLPENVRRLLAGGLSEDEGRRLVRWAAAVHDVGKATPAFACQVVPLATRMKDAGLSFPVEVTVRGRQACPHASASHLVVRRWLETRGFAARVSRTYAVVPGGHHGVAPTTWGLQAADEDRLVGAGPWIKVQDELCDHAAHVAGLDLGQRADRPLPVRAQVLLTAVVILADWIASDESRFPYADPSPSVERAHRAWLTLGLTPPWRAGPPGDDADALLQRRFDLPAGARPRPVQEAAVALAAEVDTPGLLVIEAPMGEGKTEAALAAAEVFAARTGAGGCFVALPTMATSNAMFGRVESWVEHLELDDDVSFLLAHGKAALNDRYGELLRRSRLRGIGDDEVGAGVPVALEWLSGRKKGVLSSFVVGTIDQVLVGGLRSRHLVLRHLALASKVVVVDEVHAADAWMSVYLTRVLEWLAAYGVPVVLLSATLPPRRRGELVAAYERGRRGVQPVPTSQVPRWQRTATRSGDEAAGERAASAEGYPLVVATTSTEPVVRVVEASSRRWSVDVEEMEDSEESLLQLLDQALVDGGCVGVVRNTVGRAQATAELLREVYGADVVLVHSRLLAPDRAVREQELVARLGPDAGARRPRRLVVVGTQVLEQSLDVDFDLLVTDIAPVDLVLQRVGRLHRHDRPGRPAALRRPRCLLTGVDDGEALPPHIGRPAERVYGRAPLLASLAVLRRHRAEVGELRVPEDVAPLVRRAYADDLEVLPSWAETYHEAEAARRAREAKTVAEAATWSLGGATLTPDLVDWSSRGVGDADGDGPRGQASVRDSDDSPEVIVAQRVGDDLRLVPWVFPHGGAVLTTAGEPDRRLAMALARCTVRLPAWTSRGDALLDALERDGVAAWQTSPWLRGQLVLVLDEALRAAVGGWVFTLTQRDGLRAERDQEEDV